MLIWIYGNSHGNVRWIKQTSEVTWIEWNGSEYGTIKIEVTLNALFCLFFTAIFGVRVKRIKAKLVYCNNWQWLFIFRSFCYFGKCKIVKRVFFQKGNVSSIIVVHPNPAQNVKHQKFMKLKIIKCFIWIYLPVIGIIFFL